MRKKLTPAFVKAAPPPEKGDRTIYWDTTQPGFGLMVTRSGHGSYVALGGSNCFGFVCQHRRLPLDGDASPQPYNSKHIASPA
jgi:hypothetical protein